MRSLDIQMFDRQVVELTFTDGARARAHVLSVDPDVGENQVFYDLLEVLDPGAKGFPTPIKPVAIACSSSEIAGVKPTDGTRYVKAPGSRLYGDRAAG